MLKTSPWLAPAGGGRLPARGGCLGRRRPRVNRRDPSGVGAAACGARVMSHLLITTRNAPVQQSQRKEQVAPKPTNRNSCSRSVTSRAVGSTPAVTPKQQWRLAHKPWRRGLRQFGRIPKNAQGSPPPGVFLAQTIRQSRDCRAPSRPQGGPPDGSPARQWSGSGSPQRRW